MGREKMEKQKKVIKEYLQPIVIAVLVAIFVRTFVVQAFRIPSGSMEPTLLVGDYILVNKFIYGIVIPYTHIRLFPYHKPHRGDVVVFIYPVNPAQDFVKRVIGTEGEKVQIIQNRIYVNDRLISDPWGHFTYKWPAEYLQMMENFGPVVVPKDSLFVLGDNRENSDDSRFWGFVPLHDVLGKSFIVYFSWNKGAADLWDKVRWSRLGRLISGS
jgi:signal peptidase I